LGFEAETSTCSFLHFCIAHLSFSSTCPESTAGDLIPMHIFGVPMLQNIAVDLCVAVVGNQSAKLFVLAARPVTARLAGCVFDNTLVQLCYKAVSDFHSFL